MAIYHNIIPNCFYCKLNNNVMQVSKFGQLLHFPSELHNTIKKELLKTCIVFFDAIKCYYK